MILRIFMPHGAHIRFDGVEKVQALGTSYVNFFYEAKDQTGKATDNKAHAVFNTSVIAGYSLEKD